MGEIRKLYLAQFIYGFGCMASYTFTLYFLAHGLSQAQISLLFSVYFIATVILEIPTGGFADTFGHKASFALGLIIEAFYYLIFFLFPSFNGFLFGMIVAALGLTFQSGANNSLTYEILNKLGKKDDYLKINGIIGAMMSLAVIIAAPIGTWIYKFHPSLPYLISFILVFLSGLAVYLVKYEFTGVMPTVGNYVNQIKTGVALTLRNHRLLALFLVGIATLTVSYVFDVNIVAPLQLKMGIDVSLIGFTQSLIAIGYVIVNYVTYRLVDKIGDMPALFVSLLISFISFLVLSQISYFYGVALIVIFFMSHGLRINVLDSIVQKEASSEQRSTIASAGSVIKSLGAAVLMPLGGWAIDKTGMSQTLIILAFFILIVGVIGGVTYSKLKIYQAV